MTDPKPPKSRLPRPSTILLIGLVLLIVCGAMMVWLPYQRYQREQQVITYVERLEGGIESEIVRPFWIPEAVDDEYLELFERVYIVFYSHTRVTDADLEQLRGLTNLQSLYLDNTQVTDAGLEHLRGLTNLNLLNLYNTQGDCAILGSLLTLGNSRLAAR